MAERNQLRGAFCGADTRNLRNGQHIAFFDLPSADQIKGGLLHVNFTARNGYTLCIGLGSHIYHVSASLFVKMG